MTWPSHLYRSHSTGFLCELHSGLSLRQSCLALCEQTMAENWWTSDATIMQQFRAKRATTADQVHPLMTVTPPPPEGWCTLQDNKKCLGMAWWTWRRVQVVNLTSKFPRPKCDQAIVGHAGTSPIHGSPNMHHAWLWHVEAWTSVASATRISEADPLCPVAFKAGPSYTYILRSK